MQKLLLFLMALLVFMGCTHGTTLTQATDPDLQPQTLQGPLEELYEVAFAAAKKAFPDEIYIRSDDVPKIVIQRDWFWRGDTKVEVLLQPISDNEYFVTVKSWASWHRLNATMLDVSEDEVRHYIRTLKEEYAEYKSPKINEKTLSGRLSELQQAYDGGLLTQEEYDSKRSEILKQY
jgi:hypothetical protein